MTIPLFSLKGTVGRSYRVDPEDTRRTKQALLELGYFKPPAYGLTDYPDEPLFTAIETFQQDNGLYRDGIMRPDGETATALAQRLVETIQRSDISSERESSSPQSPLGRASQILLSGNLAGNAPTSGEASDDEQLAMMRRRDNMIAPSPGDIIPPLILGGGAAGILSQQRGKDPQRYEVTEPPPSVPPSEPDGEEPGDHEEIRPSAPIPINLAHPVPEDHPPGIYIHPVPDEELATLGQIVENRRGNKLTRDQLDRLRDYILANNKDWIHIAGGRDASTGEQKKEYHIPGPGARMANNVHVGGHYTDLTFQTANGKIIHIQTVDVDRNGKPTARELDIAERIRRLQPDADIILFPKVHQLDKLRRPR